MNIIHFQININYASFSVKSKIECEEFDFENLIKNLQNLYDGKNKSVVFNHLERQLSIKFDSLEHGHIKVTVELFQYIFDDDICESMLQFEYMIDQSFLPELIDEISNVVKLVE